MSNPKIKADYQKFRMCMAEGDPLGLVVQGEQNPNSAVTDSFMYPELDRKLKEGRITAITEQLKNSHGAHFNFLVLGNEAVNRVPDLVTANHLLNLINEGEYSWVYIGDVRNKENKPKFDFMKALVTVAQFEDYKEHGVEYYGRSLGEQDILQQMNLTAQQLGKMRKLLKETPMWELKTYEFTDVIAGTSIPSWFTRLLSSVGAKQLSQLEAERVAGEGK